MKLLDDTEPAARRVLIETYRRMSALRKWQIIEDANQRMRILHAIGLRSREPELSDDQIHRDWLRLMFGFHVGGTRAMPPTQNESLQVLREVMGVFRAMGIPTAVGGSMASSLHGIPRQTQDADITAEPFPGREVEFAAHFDEAYYVDVEMIRSAMRRRASFNVINLHMGFKVDVFIRGDRPFDLSAMQRRGPKPLSASPDDVVDVHSPEDTILMKLDWYRIGGEMSDRQWADILGVLRVQAGKLDDTYLDHWANELSLNDLLRRAREQAQE